MVDICILLYSTEAAKYVEGSEKNPIKLLKYTPITNYLPLKKC